MKAFIFSGLILFSLVSKADSFPKQAIKTDARRVSLLYITPIANYLNIKVQNGGETEQTYSKFIYSKQFIDFAALYQQMIEFAQRECLYLNIGGNSDRYSSLISLTHDRVPNCQVR